MKGMKVSIAIIAAASIVIGFGGMAYAFHSGGVAECEGCHSMHSPMGGALLTKSDASSTCLNCHENANDTGPSSYHVSTADAKLGPGMAPLQRTPGGDFGWLKKSYSFTVRGTANVEKGQTHGHNIVAKDFNYIADSDFATAPGGGNFNATALACNSCHDQHSAWRRTDMTGTLVKPGLGVAVPPIKASGSYHSSAAPDAMGAVGVFRLLAGTGWVADGVTFAVSPPHASVNSSYNKTEANQTIRDAYGKGMGQWCATCHPDMHTSSGKLVHPVSQNFTSAILANYNAYVKSGDLTGAQATSYSSLAPYELNSSDYAILQSQATYTVKLQPGPAAINEAQVMCLSCHRAHASGWPEGLRWMYQAEFMTYNGLYPGTDNGAPPQFARGRTSAETQAAYYDRPITDFATYQRMYCNKCHAKD